VGARGKEIVSGNNIRFRRRDCRSLVKRRNLDRGGKKFKSKITGRNRCDLGGVAFLILRKKLQILLENNTPAEHWGGKKKD